MEWRHLSDQELLNIAHSVAIDEARWEFVEVAIKGAIARRHEKNFDAFLNGFFDRIQEPA
jgi:hypothetical protein